MTTTTCPHACLEWQEGTSLHSRQTHAWWIACLGNPLCKRRLTLRRCMLTREKMANVSMHWNACVRESGGCDQLTRRHVELSAMIKSRIRSALYSHSLWRPGALNRPRHSPSSRRRSPLSYLSCLSSPQFTKRSTIRRREEDCLWKYCEWAMWQRCIPQPR